MAVVTGMSDGHRTERADPLAHMLERPLFGILPINGEKLAYGLLIVAAAILRLWDLGPRMLHHDESLHALYSYYLFNGRGYVHDPMMHGPFLFEIGALLYFLFGATDAVARLGTSLFGIVLVGLAWMTREFIGRLAAFIAAAFLAFGPSIIYYSRFQRHDIYLAVFQLLFLLGIYRYIAHQRRGDLWLVVTSLSLAFCTKEDTYLQLFYLAFVLIALSWKDLPAIGQLIVQSVTRRGTVPTLSPVAQVSLLIGTISLPLAAGGFEYIFLHTAVDPARANIYLSAIFVIMAVVGALVGTRWNAQIWVMAAVIFWGIFVALYTTFFSNPGGFYSGAIGGLKYWIDQQGVARGNQPWFYYLILLPLYEFVAVLFGLAGAAYILVKHRVGAATPVRRFHLLLVYWAFGALLLYGWASEKMPWMVIHMAIPLAFLAAVAIARLIQGVVALEPPWQRLGTFVLALFLTGAALVSGIANLSSDPSPLAALSAIFAGQAPPAAVTRLFQGLAITATGCVLLTVTVTLGSRLGLGLALRTVALSALLVLVPLSVRTAWQVNFYNGDVPVEMLVYTQTSPDVRQVLDEVDRVAFRTGQGREKVKIVYDSGVSWPFEWYLRDYPGRVFIGAGTVPSSAMDAPIMIIGTEGGRDEAVRRQLGTRYVSQRYRLRWWFPEDYRSIQLESIQSFFTDPRTRARIWRYFMFRETLNPLGSTDFVMFVRRELASGAWAAPLASQQLIDEAAYERATRQVTATAALGGTRGSGENQMADPKAVALGRDGSIFVADTFNHRILKYAQDGRFLMAFGGEGNQDGQLKEPWGIAVGLNGDIYVADTWNHRVQVFTADGAYKAKWGNSRLVPTLNEAPGDFFGPRGIAVDPQGQVLVTDTGNHRIQRFSPTGQFMGAYGGRGAGEGLLAEPVGIAVDRTGNIYVADTWNHRVQKLDPRGAYAAQWLVFGWESESVVNKPGLALDADGSVYVTDPEGQRVIKFSPAGQVTAVFGKPGRDLASLALPTGLAVTPNGEVLVADSQNNRVLRFAPVR